MKILLASTLLALLSQSSALSVLQRTFVTPDAGRILYGLSVPADYNSRQPRPLVLALHPGGERTPYYSLSFMRGIVSPALKDLGAIIVAPDCPTRETIEPRPLLRGPNVPIGFDNRVCRSEQFDVRQGPEGQQPVLCTPSG